MYAFAGPVEHMAKAVREHRTTRGGRSSSWNKSSTSTSTVANCSSTGSCSPFSLSRVCTSALRVNTSPLQQQPPQHQTLFHRIKSATTSTTLNWWSTLTSVVQVPSAALLPFSWPLRLNSTLAVSSTTSSPAPTALCPDAPLPSTLLTPSNQAASNDQESSSNNGGSGNGGSDGLEPQPPSDQKQLLSNFLSPADADEIKYACLLSDLSNAAYDISSDALSSVLERYHLALATTSASCSFGPVCLADWEAEVDHGMAWTGNHAEASSRSPQKSTPAADEDHLGTTLQPEQHPSGQGQQLGRTHETAAGLPTLEGSKKDMGLSRSSLLQPPTVDSSSHPNVGTAQNASPANTSRPASPASFPPTPEISHTPQPMSSPSDSPSLSRTHSSSNLVADAPPPARLSPSVTIVSLSNEAETVGMAMAWPNTFHYPLLTQMPRALAPNPTRRSSADGIAASFADPASRPMCSLLGTDGSNTGNQPHAAPSAHRASSEGADVILEGTLCASSEGGPAAPRGAHLEHEVAEEELPTACAQLPSVGGSGSGTARVEDSRRQRKCRSCGQLPTDGGSCCESASGVEEEEEDLQLRVCAQKQQAVSVAIGGKGLASACFRDEPEAPGTPPQQVEHTFSQRYSPPDVHLPHPPLSAPALVDGIEVTELGLSCGPDAEPAQCSSKPPCEWFVCDDGATNTRYFAIQGSITLQHWQINLQFDPVIFEDPAYGVRVHRGVYETALKLYNDLVPLVRQHLASSQSPSQPPPRIAFTGHSLGGSLSTVLTLLLLHRGVANPQQVAPAYTFGAPAVFCGGEDGAAFLQQPLQQRRQQQQHYCEETSSEAVRVPKQALTSEAQAVGASAPADDAGGPAVYASAHASKPVHDVDAEASRNACCSLGILQRLGLTDRHFVNIIMHRDIVPRAFGCDYALVADLLKQWLPSFKTHPPLQGDYKSLYNFLGSVAVLKPHASSPFVQPADAGHPLLPELPGLFHLRAPSATDTPHQQPQQQPQQQQVQQYGEVHGSQGSPAAQTCSMPALAALSSIPSSKHTSDATQEASQDVSTPVASASPLGTLSPSISPSSGSRAAATPRTSEGRTSGKGITFASNFDGIQASTCDDDLRLFTSHSSVPHGTHQAHTSGRTSAAATHNTPAPPLQPTTASFSSTPSSHPTCPPPFSSSTCLNSISTTLPAAAAVAAAVHAQPAENISTATTAPHQTPVTTFQPTSASTAQAAAAAVAAAVHAHPAEADMGPGTLQDQAAVAAAAVAAAAAATAFSGDSLAPRYSRHLRPTLGASSPSPLHTSSESAAAAATAFFGDSLAPCHSRHHRPAAGAPSLSPLHILSEPSCPSHHASGRELKEVVPLQLSTQQQQQPFVQQQQQQQRQLPPSNNILAAGRVRHSLISQEHQAGPVATGVSALEPQSGDDSEANLDTSRVEMDGNGKAIWGSIAAIQGQAASAAAAAGNRGGGEAHSISLSSNNSSSSSSSSSRGSLVNTGGRVVDGGFAQEESSSHGPVDCGHGEQVVGSLGRQNQRESAGNEGGGLEYTHQQLSPAVMTLQEATQLFLNTPHPLTTLSEYASYGSDGAISRYHNPDNYTKGLIILADLACMPFEDMTS